MSGFREDGPFLVSVYISASKLCCVSEFMMNLYMYSSCLHIIFFIISFRKYQKSGHGEGGLISTIPLQVLQQWLHSDTSTHRKARPRGDVRVQVSDALHGTLLCQCSVESRLELRAVFSLITIRSTGPTVCLFRLNRVQRVSLMSDIVFVCPDLREVTWHETQIKTCTNAALSDGRDETR